MEFTVLHNFSSDEFGRILNHVCIENRNHKQITVNILHLNLYMSSPYGKLIVWNCFYFKNIVVL